MAIMNLVVVDQRPCPPTRITPILYIEISSDTVDCLDEMSI